MIIRATDKNVSRAEVSNTDQDTAMRRHNHDPVIILRR